MRWDSCVESKDKWNMIWEMYFLFFMEMIFEKRIFNIFKESRRVFLVMIDDLSLKIILHEFYCLNCLTLKY